MERNVIDKVYLVCNELLFFVSYKEVPREFLKYRPMLRYSTARMGKQWSSKSFLEFFGLHNFSVYR